LIYCIVLARSAKIPDAAMAARHVVHLDAHLLDALHQRGRAAIGGRNLRCRAQRSVTKPSFASVM
jgi:hypothetical protein